MVAAVWVTCFHFPVVWLATGIGEAGRPFLDLYGILAAFDAMRAGADPFLPNALDPYHRPHIYSEWWLELARFGLGRPDTLWLGAALAGAVLLMAVVMVRPGTRRQGLDLFLLLVSPALLLAVNRANNDLVIFLLISAGLFCFRGERWPARALGVVLFAAAAVLKYYPLVTLVVLLEMRRRRGLAAGLGLYGLVLLLALPGLAQGFQSAARVIPGPEWLYAYGAPVLWRNLGLTTPSAWLLPGLLLLAWAARGAYGKMAGPFSAGPAPEHTAMREFMCGAAMLVGLFFLGASYVYKLIFALWLLPWLWQQCGGGAPAARWGRATWGLLLAVVWLEGGMAVVLNLLIGPRSLPVAEGLLKATLVISQLLTWALVACLLRFLLIYVAQRGRALFLSGRPA